jgi:hypothetical protein
VGVCFFLRRGLLRHLPTHAVWYPPRQRKVGAALGCAAVYGAYVPTQAAQSWRSFGLRCCVWCVWTLPHPAGASSSDSSTPCLALPCLALPGTFREGKGKGRKEGVGGWVGGWVGWGTGGNTVIFWGYCKMGVPARGTAQGRQGRGAAGQAPKRKKGRSL